MTNHSRISAIVLLVSGILWPAAGAQAQWYSSVTQPAPLYPYAVPQNQPYAVQVAPNAYVIHRPAVAPPRARESRIAKPARVKRAQAVKHRRGKVDPALVEELRQRPKAKTATISTSRVVYKKPIVRETTRYVDDPPRVVERYHVVDDDHAGPHDKPTARVDNDSGSIVIQRKGVKRGMNSGRGLDGGEKRVISAEAEITILGPDRMNIRLFRKGGKANALAD